MQSVVAMSEKRVGGNKEKVEKSLYLKINVVVTLSTVPSVTVLEVFQNMQRRHENLQGSKTQLIGRGDNIPQVVW